MRSAAAIRKADERERHRAAGDYYLQRWIPGAARAEIEAAIERILQEHETTGATSSATVTTPATSKDETR